MQTPAIPTETDPVPPPATESARVRRSPLTPCTDQLVGDILSGWRYDISGLSPAMRTDYEQHLLECGHCRSKQRLHRTVDWLLISVSSLSIAAFMLAVAVIHRVESLTHIGTLHVHLRSAPVAISLYAVAIAGLVISMLLWVLVAVATPLGSSFGSLRQRTSRIVRDRIAPHPLAPDSLAAVPLAMHPPVTESTVSDPIHRSA